MKRAIRKLMMGRGQGHHVQRQNTIRHRRENLAAIWHNTYEEDAGLEKIVRMALAASQFLFLGMYIKHLFWRKGPLYQDLATELFVLAKAVFPLLVLANGWQASPAVVALIAWFGLETVMYIPTLIFASDVFGTPRSYRRSTLLLFLNYLEVVLAFAVLYASGPHLQRPLAHWTEAVYFSFISSSTIGFGDLYPVTNTGRVLVVVQSLFYLSYIVLVINFFGFRMGRGYFDRKDTRSSSEGTGEA